MQNFVGYLAKTFKVKNLFFAIKEPVCDSFLSTKRTSGCNGSMLTLTSEEIVQAAILELLIKATIETLVGMKLIASLKLHIFKNYSTNYIFF